MARQTRLCGLQQGDHVELHTAAGEQIVLVAVRCQNGFVRLEVDAASACGSFRDDRLTTERADVECTTLRYTFARTQRKDTTMNTTTQRKCHFCRQPFDVAEMYRRTTPTGEKWCCSSCPKRKGGKAPSLDAGNLLGRYRVLARRPCVATEADLPHLGEPEHFLTRIEKSA